MQRQEIALLIASIVLVIIIIMVISLFVIFQKRKNELLYKQREAKKKYEQEIAETQIEIREETLRNISWELHDNIGQLLTLAKIQANIAQDDPSKLPDAIDTLSKSLTELRALSKLINPDAIKNLSLIEAIQLEVERFNRLQFIEASLSTTDDLYDIDKKVEIIIFRILQEFFSNTIKHSKASQLHVSLDYQEDKLVIHARDNGIGFTIGEHHLHSGIGLTNMKSRAKLINAEVDLFSKEDYGTTITLTYFYIKEKEPLPS
ncbi:sensor histidine kinase [Aquimarina rhabdastrellae]